MDDRPRHDIRRARAGDREALNRLLLRVQRQVMERAAVRLGRGLGRRVRISDLLQSTYLEVVRSIRGFDGDSDDAFAAWVEQILENNIRDKRRFHAAQKRDREREKVRELGSIASTAPVANPSQAAEVFDELHLVHEALEELPAHYRDIIRRRLVGGEPYEQIATELGRTQSSSRVLMLRARAALILEVDRLRQVRKS